MDFGSLIVAHMVGDYLLQNDWQAQNKPSNSWACFVHCIFYTLAVAVMTLACGAMWPVWALAVCFVLHFVIDRWRLAPKAMEYTGQAGFRDNLGPWSAIIVDNTWHLVTLWVLWLLV